MPESVSIRTSTVLLPGRAVDWLAGSGFDDFEAEGKGLEAGNPHGAPIVLPPELEASVGLAKFAAKTTCPTRVELGCPYPPAPIRQVRARRLSVVLYRFTKVSIGEASK